MAILQDDHSKVLNELILRNHETYGLLYRKVTHNHTQHVSLIAMI